MVRFLSFLLLIFIPVQLSSQVLVNEFSSSNSGGITDEDGDHSDWIELYNSSTLETDLSGFHLSDDARNLKRWTFPAISMKPGSFLLVFASGKNRTDPPVSYKTVIDNGTDWQYLVPSSDIGNAWKDRGYDASGWNTGPGGFGYGDNDDATVLDKIISVFIRKEFVINNLQDISELVLSIDYDDGFVAYINGHEIARSNLGATGIPVPFNQLAISAREATMFSGGNPENYRIPDPANYLVEGVNVIAIQGHNNDASSSDLSLIPMLTLGSQASLLPDNIPAYIKLSGKKLHTNFKISSEGETLILSRPDSSVVDSVSPVSLFKDISYGRKPDGENSWAYFKSPTPAAPNISKGFSTPARSDSVKFSARGGYYPGGFELKLSCNDPADSIFFTINGSDPIVKGSFYKNPINISGNMVIRAVSVNSEKFPGVASANTYITRHHTLPVVCLSTDSVNLWDYNNGIYVMGPNASPDYPYFGANFWQDWEKEAHMEYYDAAGVKRIDQNIGIKIYGMWSRANAQKSMALFARSEYGKSSLDYKFFKDKPIDKFESLILRNGGNDWNQGIMRDGLTSTLVRAMDIDRLAFQPAVVYINGDYWGILNLREKINPSFLAENHSVNPDDVNLLEADATIVDGTNAQYQQLNSFLSSNTLETEQNYLQASNQIDVNNYIQYQLTEIYINNKDWPCNNIKFWNTNKAGSLWRWIIYDTDFGFSIWENTAYTFNTLAFALALDGPSWPNPPWSTLLFRRMMSNTGFRNEFVNQYADRLNTSFAPGRVVGIVDSLKQVYLPEVTDHLSRWELDYNNWLFNISIIKNYANNRPVYARDQLRSVLGLNEPLNINIVINSPGAGKVRINSVIPNKYPFSGVYFKDLPIKLTAIPAPGYKFSNWLTGSSVSPVRTLDYNMHTAATFTAVFKTAESSDNRIVINEINYASSPQKDSKDWIELFNAGSSTVNLKDWTISDSGPEAGFKIASDIILSPGMNIVMCREMNAFKLIYPQVRNITGDLNFGLSSSGDDINLFDPEGNLIDFVNFTPNAPWPTDANGTGASIALTSPILDNNSGINWKSVVNGGTPGEVNFLTDVNTTGEDLNEGISLSCFPNPFRDYTTISINVTMGGRYRLEIYDMQGRMMKTLADKIFQPGAYSIDLGGKSISDGLPERGVYILRLSGAKRVSNLKVIYLD